MMQKIELGDKTCRHQYRTTKERSKSGHIQFRRKLETENFRQVELPIRKKNEKGKPGFF
jgi:hypothetical protein